MSLTVEEAVAQLPEYMEPGSSGYLCAMVDSFFVGASDLQGNYEVPTDLILDGVRGKNSVELAKSYQAYAGIGTDGGIGLETRDKMAEYGFNLEAVAANSAGMPPTIFVQPDGSKIAWSLEGGAVPAFSELPPNAFNAQPNAAPVSKEPTLS